jgi:serine/threonine-protein kinase
VAALPTEADLTAVGTVMGTPLYVAPEVLAGRAANPQADLYSLAATGFHLLTGRPLFTGKSIEQLLRRTLRDEAPVPSSLVPAAGIPPALDRIFQRALSKNPSERPESMEAFRRSLEPFSAAAGASRSLISNQDSRSTE